MSKELAIGIVIGGAVSSSLGAAVSKSGAMLGGLKQKAEDARGLQTLIGHTQRLQREYREAFLAGSREADGIRRKIDQHNTALKAAGLDVGNLDRAYAKLGRTVKGIEWQTAGKEKIQSGVELGRTAAAGVGLAAIPTKTSGDYQAEVRDIAIKAGVAGQAGEKELDRRIREAAARQKMSQTELAAAVNGLVTQGMDWKQVVGGINDKGEKIAGYGDLLGELTIGQKMDPGDAAKLIYAFEQNGVKQADMRKVMGEIAVAGDLGAFESDKMAKFLPELMATVGSMGLQGPKAARFLAASLQAQIKLTGDADSAANNFKNLLSKIIAPDTTKKFADAGIDLQGSMEASMRKHGDGPVAAFIRLTEHLAVNGDEARAKKIAALKAKVKNSAGDKKAEEEALSAYMQAAGLGEVLTDMQARSAALAQIKYADQIKADLAKIENTDGGKKLSGDKAARDETSNRKWETVASEFNAAMVSVGDAIRPVTDAAADLAAGALKLGSALTQGNPGLALGAVAGGLALLVVAAKRVVGGATQWATGKVLEKVGFRLPGGRGGAKGGIADMLGNALGGATSGSGVQQVFVTNWPSGGAGALGGDMPGGPDGAGKPGVKSGAAKAGRLARVGGTLKSAGRFLGRNAAGVLAVGAAAYQVYDTAKNAKTVEEKGRGYGGAAGTLAGGLAGAKLGAVIGTMIAPGIGTAIGGVLGGAIGAFGGDKIGGWLGKTVATAGGEKKPSQLPTVASVQAPADKPAQAVTPALPVVGKTPAPVVPVAALAVAGSEKKVPSTSPSAVPASTGKPPQAITPAVPVVVKAPAPAVQAVAQVATGGEKKGAPVAPSVVMVPASTGKPAPTVAPAVPVVVKMPMPAVVAAAPLASGGEKKPAPPPAPVPQPVPKPPSPPATPAPAATGKAPAVKQQTFTFNPTIQVTVKGDVKDPRQIAAEIAPHLKRIFDGWQQQASRSAMFDPVG